MLLEADGHFTLNLHTTQKNVYTNICINFALPSCDEQYLNNVIVCSLSNP